MTDKEVRAWIKERDRVAKTYNVDAFRKFYRKWMNRGLYTLNLPKSDLVIEISMRKMVYHMKSATEQEKAEAAKWLLEHGSNTRL